MKKVFVFLACFMLLVPFASAGIIDGWIKGLFEKDVRFNEPGLQEPEDVSGPNYDDTIEPGPESEESTEAAVPCEDGGTCDEDGEDDFTEESESPLGDEASVEDGGTCEGGGCGGGEGNEADLSGTISGEVKIDEKDPFKQIINLPKEENNERKESIDSETGNKIVESPTAKPADPTSGAIIDPNAGDNYQRSGEEQAKYDAERARAEAVSAIRMDFQERRQELENKLIQAQMEIDEAKARGEGYFARKDERRVKKEIEDQIKDLKKEQRKFEREQKQNPVMRFAEDFFDDGVVTAINKYEKYKEGDGVGVVVRVGDTDIDGASLLDQGSETGIGPSVRVSGDNPKELWESFKDIFSRDPDNDIDKEKVLIPN